MRIYINNHSKINKIFRVLWSLLYLMLFRYTPVIGFNWLRINLLRLFGAKVGKGCRVFPSVKVWAPWNLELGNYVAIAHYVDLYSVDKIIVGDYVTISQYSFICTASHDISRLSLPLVCSPIKIESYSWVCADCFIHKGVTIKHASIISARSNLYTNTDISSVYSGNPALKVGERKIRDNKE